MDCLPSVAYMSINVIKCDQAINLLLSCHMLLETRKIKHKLILCECPLVVDEDTMISMSKTYCCSDDVFLYVQSKQQMIMTAKSVAKNGEKLVKFARVLVKYSADKR